jgi:hypothetical protein
MGEIFETMRKLMNFTFMAVPSSDGFYGAKVNYNNKYSTRQHRPPG